MQTPSLQARGQGWVTGEAASPMEPWPPLRAQPLSRILGPRYWGEKEGGKKRILFLFRSADHCEILPAPALPAPPAALALAALPKKLPPVPKGDVPHVPK